MRLRQVNIRLSEEEYRLLRYWSYRTEKTLSDFARESMLASAANLQLEESNRSAQPTLELR